MSWFERGHSSEDCNSVLRRRRNSCLWHNPNTASGTQPACCLMEAGRESHLPRSSYTEIVSYHIWKHSLKRAARIRNRRTLPGGVVCVVSKSCYANDTNSLPPHVIVPCLTLWTSSECSMCHPSSPCILLVHTTPLRTWTVLHIVNNEWTNVLTEVIGTNSWRSSIVLREICCAWLTQSVWNKIWILWSYKAKTHQIN